MGVEVFGVICTFQSSQFFDRLSMHFGVVDRIRASALTTVIWYSWPLRFFCLISVYSYSHHSKGNDAQHWMKACLKWIVGTVHIRYICLSPLVILEVKYITRKCNFGQITKRGWSSRHPISSAPFVQSKQCLNPKMFLKQIKTYWNILPV